MSTETKKSISDKLNVRGFALPQRLDHSEISHPNADIPPHIKLPPLALPNVSYTPASTIFSIELTHPEEDDTGTTTTRTLAQTSLPSESYNSSSWRAASLSANHYFYPTTSHSNHDPTPQETPTSRTAMQTDSFPSLVENSPGDSPDSLSPQGSKVPQSVHIPSHSPLSNISVDSPIPHPNNQSRSLFAMMDSIPPSPSSPLISHHLLQKHFRPRDMVNIQVLHESPLSDGSPSSQRPTSFGSPGASIVQHTNMPYHSIVLSSNPSSPTVQRTMESNQSRVPVTPSQNVHTNPIFQQHVHKYSYAVSFHNEFKTPKTPDTYKPNSLFHDVIQFSTGEESSKVTTEQKIFSIRRLNQNLMKTENILKSHTSSGPKYHIRTNGTSHLQVQPNATHKTTPQTPNFVRKLAQKNYHLQNMECSILPVEVVEHIFQFCDFLEENTPFKDYFDTQMCEAHALLFPPTVHTILPTMKSQHQQRHRLWFLYWRKFSSRIFNHIFHLFYGKKGASVIRMVWHFNAERDLLGIRRRNFDVTKGTDVEYHWFTIPVSGMRSVALPRANVLEFAEWVMEELYKYKLWKKGQSPTKPWSIGMDEIAVDLCVGIGNDSGAVLRGWDKVRAILRAGKRIVKRDAKESRGDIPSRVIRTPPLPVMNVAKKTTAARRRYIELTSPPSKATRSALNGQVRSNAQHKRQMLTTVQRSVSNDSIDALEEESQDFLDPDNEYGPVYLPPSPHALQASEGNKSGRMRFSLSPQHDEGDTSPLSAWKKSTPRDEEASLTAAKVPQLTSMSSLAALIRTDSMDDEEHSNLRDSLRMTKSLLMDYEVWRKKDSKLTSHMWQAKGFKKEPHIGMALTPPRSSSQGAELEDVGLSPILLQSQLLNTPEKKSVFSSPGPRTLFPSPSNGSFLGLHSSTLRGGMVDYSHLSQTKVLPTSKKKLLTPLRINTNRSHPESTIPSPRESSPTDFFVLPPTPMNSRAASRVQTPLSGSEHKSENDPDVRAALRYYIRDCSYIPLHTNKSEVSEDKIVGSIRFWGLKAQWLFNKITSLSLDEELNGSKSILDLVSRCNSLRVLSLTRVKNASTRLLSILATHPKLRRVQLKLCSNDIAAAVLQNFGVTALTLGFVNLHLGNMVHSRSAFDKHVLAAIADNISVARLQVEDRTSNNKLLNSLLSCTNAKRVVVRQSRGCCPDFSNLSLSVESLHLEHSYTQRFINTEPEWYNLRLSKVRRVVLINIFGAHNEELVELLCHGLSQCTQVESLYLRDDGLRNEDVAFLLAMPKLKNVWIKSPQLDINLSHHVKHKNESLEGIRINGGGQLDWLLFDSVKQMFPRAVQCEDVSEEILFDR